MVCPLCDDRRAKRSCPAVGQQICSVCCGTKRLVEIRCPSDCVYLTSAREHPPAAVLRQQHRDVGMLAAWLEDLNTRQSQLLFLVVTFVKRYQPPELQRLLDDDVVEALGALAGTFETASRGVIYEHRPASLPADRLASALKQLLADAGKNQPSSFDRDVAVVLRRVEQTARASRSTDPDNPRAWLDGVDRIIKGAEARSEDEKNAPESPRLIVP